MKLILILGLLVPNVAMTTELKTEVRDTAAKSELLRLRGLRLQWLDLSGTQTSPAGRVVVSEDGGLLKIKGRQDRKLYSDEGKGDFVEIDGVVTQVDKKKFKFHGQIISKVYYLAGGTPCRKDGDFDFAKTGNRKYWRIQQKEHGCGEDAVDYVDLLP